MRSRGRTPRKPEMTRCEYQAARITLGMSGLEFARALGVCKSAGSRYEGGSRTVHKAVARRVCRLLNAKCRRDNTLHPWALYAWCLKTHGTLTNAAAKLGVCTSELSKFANGRRSIPRWIAEHVGAAPTPKRHPRGFPKPGGRPPKPIAMTPEEYRRCRLLTGMDKKAFSLAIGAGPSVGWCYERGKIRVNAGVAERVLRVVAEHQARAA